MGRLRKKRMHVNNKTIKKKYRTKRRTKDLDQIQEDMEPQNSHKLINQERDQDLPGEGQYYCLHCARYFINEEALKKHFKTKLHKRRLAALREPVYTQKEAEMAAGMGPYILPAPPLDTGMRTDSMGMRTDGMEMRTDGMEMRTDGMGMRTNSMGMRTDNTGMSSIEVKIHDGSDCSNVNRIVSLDKQLMTLQV